MGSLQSEKLAFADSESSLRRAVEIIEATSGKEGQGLVLHLGALGFTLVYQGKYQEAREQFQRALAIREKLGDPRHPVLFYVYWGLGEADLGLGENARALAWLERSRGLRELAMAPSEAAEEQFALARALLASGRDEKRARDLLAEAHAVFAKETTSPREKRVLRSIEAVASQSGAHLGESHP